MEAGWMMIVKALGSLTLVIATIFAMAWVFKRFIQPLQTSAKTQGFRITSMQDLGAKKKLLVVEFESKRLLVGMTENSMSTLCSIESSNSPTSSLGDWKPADEQVSRA